MWVAAIVVIGKLILMRKDKCFMALPININVTSSENHYFPLVESEMQSSAIFEKI